MCVFWFRNRKICLVFAVPLPPSPNINGNFSPFATAVQPQPRVVASPRTRAPPLDPPSPAAAAPETFERAPVAAPAERATRTRPRSGRQAQATSREPPPREPVRVAVRQPPARVDRGGGGGGGGGGYERNTGRGRGDDLWERDNLVRHVQNASEFDALKVRPRGVGGGCVFFVV